MFLEKLLNYYRGDNLLLRGKDQNHPHFECTNKDNYTNREIFNKYKKDNCKFKKDIIDSQLRNTKYCEISDNDDFESEDDDYLSDDNANHYIIEKETENEDEENINYDYPSTEFRENLSDLEPNEYIIRENRTKNENEANKNCQDLNAEGYHNEQEDEINVEFIENSKYGFLMMNENECMLSEFNEKNQQNNNKIASESAKNKALEKWNRKGKNQNIKSKLTRSALSYLVHQPGFDLVDFNETRSSTMIYLMKNGNTLTNRPISVPGSGKII